MIVLGLSPNPAIKPVAAPAAHSILKNGNLPQSSYVPPYTVQSPYSTMVSLLWIGFSAVLSLS